ncbi:MAG: IPT/TIG domain-containing protein [Acidobacteria bacterium]|nr:IPT/TIG domain-containing protein [Acidobacteriota bacterium]
MRPLPAVCLLAALCSALAQPPTSPVVNPRGVINAYTQQPAPSPVAPGGIVWINGINLGPAAGWIADPNSPLPTQALDPPIEVRIGERAIPLYSVTPSRIVAQIPVDTPQGVTQIVVRRGEQQSAPARFTVVQPSPSIATANGLGFGSAGTVSGNALTIRASGLGQTEPPTAPGALPAADTPASPRIPVRAYVGGLPAAVTAQLSNNTPGVFEISVELPPAAQPGDAINLYSGNNAGNRVALNSLAAPRIDYLPFPRAVGNLRALTASDLHPGYLVLTGPRGDDGCWPSLLVDFASKKTADIPGCQTAAAAQLLTPFMASNDGSALAALAGPADGDATTGISSKVTILTPTAEPRDVDLPGKAATLAAGAGGTFNAILPGTPVRIAQIDPATGEVTEPNLGGVGVPGIGGGGGGAVINLNNFEVDLGDGVKELVSAPINLGQNQFGVAAVDSLDTPTKAKFAIVNAQGQPQRTVNFPDGWLPLLSPTQQAPGQGGGMAGPGGPGGPVALPGGGIVVARFRGTALLDAASRQVYLIVRATDKSKDGFLRIPVQAGQASEIHAFADSRFAASCTAQTRTFTLELARRLAVPISPTPETLIRTACGASGFVTLDFATRRLSETNLPGQGQFNVTGNAANDVNDYVYGANTDPAQQGRSDTIYVFDGVTNSAFRLDLPPEISSFANVNAFPAMGILYAQATSRTVGDAGIVVFDLENANARLLPTPAGFASVQPMTIFPATRKLIARGTRTEPAATQFLIYDLVSGDLQIIANPEGVSFVGQAPNAAPQPGQQAQQQPALQNVNPKSNAVTAVGFDAQRRPVGVLLIRSH